MAWQAPWAMNGSIAWAASPSSVTRPALQVVSGSRSYSPQRCVRSAAPMMAGTVGCQPANSASASATSPVADHDSTRQSRAGTTATKFRERPPATQ